MTKLRRRPGLVGGLLCTVTLGAISTAPAQDSGWRYNVEVSTFQTDSVGVDGGGDTEVNSYHLQASAKKDLLSNLSVRAGFSYSTHERRFTGSGDFVSLRPWGDTSRLALSTSVVTHVNKRWSLGLRPFFTTFSESGDIESDSISYGAALATVARLGADRQVGAGFRLADGIDGGLDVSPVLIVDWRLNDHWLLSNPSQPEALGSAGLELVYIPADKWHLALGGVYHSVKFLLDDRGVAPGGIGEHEAWFTFARVGRKWPSGLNVNGYIATAFDGTLTVEEANGRTLAESGHDSMPLVGVSVRTSF